MGCDVLLPLIVTSKTNFNPRTRMGCDIINRPTVMFSHNFNPRTRMGCDVVDSEVTIVGTISIHAPVWGATITF
ncbi:hypothetical protein [Streptococcus sp. 2018162]|uniref:hypothetical protein n=1 Tax=Streptococcus sp. 2018162 TaxID=2870783 RepID=UPI001C8E7D56|nr:hypothetical protein [Streptococcus sp. 2018162]MBY0730789.1 hypothetical protein [Streptococcus sp. 2018162]